MGAGTVPAVTTPWAAARLLILAEKAAARVPMVTALLSASHDRDWVKRISYHDREMGLTVRVRDRVIWMSCLHAPHPP